MPWLISDLIKPLISTDQTTPKSTGEIPVFPVRWQLPVAKWLKVAWFEKEDCIYRETPEKRSFCKISALYVESENKQTVLLGAIQR